MTRTSGARPTSDEIREVLHHAAALYLLGGPPVIDEDGDVGARESDDYFGYVIALLEDDHLDQDPQAYQAFLVSQQCRPLDREVGRDPGRMPCFEKIDEAVERLVGSIEFETERTTKRQIVDHRSAEIGHDAPPGHGRASSPSIRSSTLA